MSDAVECLFRPVLGGSQVIPSAFPTCFYAPQLFVARVYRLLCVVVLSPLVFVIMCKVLGFLQGFDYPLVLWASVMCESSLLLFLGAEPVLSSLGGMLAVSYFALAILLSLKV